MTLFDKIMASLKDANDGNNSPFFDQLIKDNAESNSHECDEYDSLEDYIDASEWLNPR